MSRRVFTLNPHEWRKGTKPSLSFLNYWVIFISSGRDIKGVTGHSVYVTSRHSKRGPQLVFCVNRGSTCHLIRQPDPGVLARKGLRASHRDTEIAFVSFLPNFISAAISLFPWVYSFPSLLLPPPFLQSSIQPKKMNKKNNCDSGVKKKEDSKLLCVRPRGVPD